MNKPKVFVYDGKPRELYSPIFDIVDVEISTNPPEGVDSFDGLILHSIVIQNFRRVLEKAKERNLPLIIQTAHRGLRGSIEEGLEVFDLNYDNLYHLSTYDEIFAKVRELFGEC